MSFWSCNIDRDGRLLRFFAGCVLLLCAGLLYVQEYIWWVPTLVVLAGIFVLFEAARGWCLLRALGLKTWR